MYNPEKAKYAQSHEWAYIEAGEAVVGISDHAQHEISDIVFVELPQVGARVEVGKRAAVIESVKSASDVYSPVSGEVIAVNDAVTADPSIVNAEPHAGGWLFKVRMSNDEDADKLMTLEDYKKSLS
jgi:glycine cleavage system H protein